LKDQLYYGQYLGNSKKLPCKALEKWQCKVSADLRAKESNMANPGPSWHAVAVGDFNGDGNADILWQNDDGTPAIWPVNATSSVGGGIVVTPGNSLSTNSTTLSVSQITQGSNSMQFISGASTSVTLNATAGKDDFVFASHATGAYSISGFDPSQDIVEFSKADFANYADLQAHSTATGGGTLIALDSAGSLLIQGVRPSELHSSNFMFV
jgi:hypothetical protein